MYKCIIFDWRQKSESQLSWVSDLSYLEHWVPLWADKKLLRIHVGGFSPSKFHFLPTWSTARPSAE